MSDGPNLSASASTDGTDLAWQPGMDDPRQQRCKACGRPDKFDFYVPNDVWESVVPDHLRTRVVCLYCFDDYAAAKGIRYAAHLSELCFVGRCATFRFTTAFSCD